jgi:virginiamycin A acetyltransferase
MANYIHRTAKISQNAIIEISSRGTHTYIGENCVIDDFVKIKHVGGVGDIRIGNLVFINSGTVLYSGNGISIGNSVLIGPNCSFTPVNHNFSDREVLIQQQGFQASKGGIIIEDDVWIGANVVILDGAIIRKGAIIGANSLVNKEIEAYSINFGSPAKFIRYR